jgi:hypothetical protein
MKVLKVFQKDIDKHPFKGYQDVLPRPGSLDHRRRPFSSCDNHIYPSSRVSIKSSAPRLSAKTVGKQSPVSPIKDSYTWPVGDVNLVLVQALISDVISTLVYVYAEKTGVARPRR